MPSPDPFHRLEQAGSRAASQPVGPPPPVSHLAVEAGRRRQRRRTFAGAAVGALMVVGLPLGVAQFAGDDQPDVVTLADAGPAVEADAAEALQGADGDADAPTPTTDELDDETTGDDADDHGQDHDFPVPPRLFELLEEDELDLQFDFGDLAFSIRTTTGDAAVAAAESAEAGADRTQEIDGQTVWIDEQGETSVVSSLVDDTFIEVTGPTAELEKLLDMASKAPFGGMFDGSERFFPEDFEGFEFPEGFPFPEGFDPETFEGFDLDEFDPEAFGFGDLDERFKELEKEFEAFEKCFEISIDETGEKTVIEVPECPLPSFEGFFPPFDLERWGDLEGLEGLEGFEGFEDFEGFERLEKLEDLDDLEQLFEGLFPEFGTDPDAEEVSA